MKIFMLNMSINFFYHNSNKFGAKGYQKSQTNLNHNKKLFLYENLIIKDKKQNFEYRGEVQ